MIEEEIVPKQDIVVNIALKILIQEYKNYIQKRNTVRKNLCKKLFQVRQLLKISSELANLDLILN